MSSLQVDFYVLESPAERETLRTACRVAEKAWSRGHRVFIHTASRDAARSIDDLLWTYRQDSFVPHALYGGDGAAETLDPVLVGDGTRFPDDIDVLINLTESVPDCAERSARVAEIVGGDDSGRRTGRERYRHYRDRGFAIQQHNI